jgi:hypothetical protein
MCLKSYFKNYFYDLMFHQNNPNEENKELVEISYLYYDRFD